MRFERKVLETMVSMYCKWNHDTVVICPECRKLTEYAFARLDECPYRKESPSACKGCPTPCYEDDMKDRIRQVMRYSGPRMMFRHPIMTMEHMKSRSS
ncbi:MAG: nitrous oxide-stimulated promoter family protein [Candidatus Methanomethylophilaceae archaeon]